MKTKNLKITSGCLAVLLLLFYINYSKANSPEEIKKFSTISDISLGDLMAQVEFINFSYITPEQAARGVDYKDTNPISMGTYNSYEVHKLSDREVNGLEGDIFLYVRNDKVEKIEFVSSGEWLGSTSTAGFMFDQFYEEREAWINDAMSYYGIPRWREKGAFQTYEKKDIVHQYKLERMEAFNVQFGWNLIYIITSEDAIENELKTEKDNLQF